MAVKAPEATPLQENFDDQPETPCWGFVLRNPPEVLSCLGFLWKIICHHGLPINDMYTDTVRHHSRCPQTKRSPRRASEQPSWCGQGQVPHPPTQVAQSIHTLVIELRAHGVQALTPALNLQGPWYSTFSIPAPHTFPK